MPNSIGLDQVVLLAQNEVWGEGSPMLQYTPRGYLGWLLSQNRPILSNYVDDGSGYIRDVNVRLRKRAGLGETVTTDDCSIQAEPAYYNQTIPALLFRKKAIFFDQEKLSLLTRPALEIMRLPFSSPERQVVREIVEEFNMHMDGFFGDIDKDCMLQQLPNFGGNAAFAGATAVQTINFSLNANQRNLTEGWANFENEVMTNGIMPDSSSMSIVGAGLINNYYRSQRFDPIKTPGDPKFFYEPLATSVWGANQFAVLKDNSVQFLNINKFQGPKAGQLGSDFFGTLRWPITDFMKQNQLSEFKFDFQARYITCPTSLVIGGVTKTVNRGWVVDIMSWFRPVYMPSDSYKSTDPLYLTNGTLRYKATNIDSSAVTP